MKIQKRELKSFLKWLLQNFLAAVHEETAPGSTTAAAAHGTALPAANPAPLSTAENSTDCGVFSLGFWDSVGVALYDLATKG